MAQIRDISKRTALYERLSKDDEQQGEYIKPYLCHFSGRKSG